MLHELPFYNELNIAKTPKAFRGYAKSDRTTVNDLDYVDIKFPVCKKDYTRLYRRITFALIYFFMKMVWFILFMYQIKKSEFAWTYC